MGRTIACANQKGGVGKTTTVINLAAYLALAGRRVLIVDLDPQGNATSGLAIDREGLDASTYDVLLGGAALADVAVPTSLQGLCVAPSTIALAGAEVELATADGRERRLARAIAQGASAFDDVFIDCPPSLGLLTVNALTAADGVLVPVQCEYYALEGLGQLVATIHLVRDHLNPDLAMEGALLTMYDARTNLAAEVAAEVRRHLTSVVYDAVIPRSVRLSEAPSYGQPIATYRPDSKGAQAYAALAKEFVARRPRQVDVALHEPESHGRADSRGPEPASHPAAREYVGVEG
ncbi:MAG TPA: AAA family ATPase [Candidatus Limnocylindrales bacterium]|nr:AAA family ATPase [Candidatus Limnocylindrales bacterium]